MKTPITLALLSSVILQSGAAEQRRPYVVHTDELSCLHTFLDQRTFVECDKSAFAIETKLRIANKEIDDEAEAKEFVAQQAEKRRAAAAAEIASSKQAIIDKYVAENPDGWACIARRIPQGRDLLDRTEEDMKACAKAFKIKRK